MAPSLITSYFLEQNTTTNTALTTPSFTPSNGEVIVVKLGTWDTNVSMGAPTGGGQTYTSALIVAPGGFKEWCGIYTATISGSPGSMTISSTPSASARYSMVVERWSSATLDATPATNSGGTTTGSSSAAASSLTTTAANSVISWVTNDVNSTDPSTRAYLGSATDDGVRDGHVGFNGVEYYAYQAVASAGSTSFGLSAPTTMSWGIAGVEVKDAGGATAVTYVPPRTVAAPATPPAPWAQRDRRNALTVATAANPLPSPLSLRRATSFAPRPAWWPQQPARRVDQSTAAAQGLPPGGTDSNEPEMLAAVLNRAPAWWPQQKVHSDVDLSTALLEVPGGTDSAEPEMAAAVTHWRRDWIRPAAMVSAVDLTTALLEVPGGTDSNEPEMLAAVLLRPSWTPQQRTALVDQSTPAGGTAFDPTLAGARSVTWRRDPTPRGQWFPSAVDLSTALLENELLGQLDDVARHRSWIRPYVAGQQRVIQVDQSVQPLDADPTLLGSLVAMVARVWPSDRREMPQQRPYISDPSFYPTVAPTDPLLLAWGAGGPLWHLYNDSALRDRRQAGQQRVYLGADLATALLENELLGGADDRGRHLTWFVDRREVPQQRAYPNVFVDDALLGSVDDLARHRAWYTDRRLVPQQRIAVIDQSVQPQPFDVRLRPWQMTAFGPANRPMPWQRLQPPIMAPVTQPVVALRAGRIVLGVLTGPGVNSGVTAGAFLTAGMRTAAYADPISDQGS